MRKGRGKRFSFFNAVAKINENGMKKHLLVLFLDDDECLIKRDAGMQKLADHPCKIKKRRKWYDRLFFNFKIRRDIGDDHVLLAEAVFGSRKRIGFDDSGFFLAA